MWDKKVAESSGESVDNAFVFQKPYEDMDIAG